MQGGDGVDADGEEQRHDGRPEVAPLVVREAERDTVLVDDRRPVADLPEHVEDQTQRSAGQQRERPQPDGRERDAALRRGGLRGPGCCDPDGVHAGTIAGARRPGKGEGPDRPAVPESARPVRCGRAEQTAD